MVDFEGVGAGVEFGDDLGVELGPTVIILIDGACLVIWAKETHHQIKRAGGFHVVSACTCHHKAILVRLAKGTNRGAKGGRANRQLILSADDTGVERCHKLFIGRRKHPVPAHLKIANRKIIRNWVEHNRIAVKGRELGQRSAVAGKKIGIHLRLRPIIGRPGIISINRLLMPGHIGRWVLVLMNTANRMAEFVNHHAGIFFSGRRFGQPAKIHRRLVTGDGERIGADIGPRARLLKGDPNLRAGIIAKDKAQIGVLTPLMRKRLKTRLHFCIAIQKTNAQGTPRLPQFAG